MTTSVRQKGLPKDIFPHTRGGDSLVSQMVISRSPGWKGSQFGTPMMEVPFQCSQPRPPPRLLPKDFRRGERSAGGGRLEAAGRTAQGLRAGLLKARTRAFFSSFGNARVACVRFFFFFLVFGVSGCCLCEEGGLIWFHGLLLKKMDVGRVP